MDFYLSNSLILQPNLLFSPKGNKLSTSNSSLTAKINYLEIPINLLYKPDGIVSIGGGIYLASALSGTFSNMLYSYQPIEKDITFEKDYQRFDYGLNFCLGIELLKGLALNANYSLGLVNIANDGVSTIRNSAIGVSLIVLAGDRPKVSN